jgi:type IV pilus assembly protein PilV
VFSLRKHNKKEYVGHALPMTETLGFSLIEVLVAGTVFSLGLAGLAALLLASITGSSQARGQSIASMAAANLAEQIRLNPNTLDRYLNPPGKISRICSGDDLCTPEQQADYDFRFWQLELADSIQKARGLVCRDATPEDGVEANSRCDGTGPLVIKIFWNSRGNDDRGQANQQRYTLVIS